MHTKTLPALSRSRRVLLKLITLVISFAFGLFVLEIGLRIVGFSDPDFYQADETLGYGLIPGMSGWYSREGRSWVDINAEGFRDAEHPIEKPAGTYRIAIIGDSFVEALQVNRDEMFTNYIPQDLDCPDANGRRTEVLTFGVSGYGTAQEYIMLREHVLRYSPDLVLLLVTTNNDISDNLRTFKQAPIPYFDVVNGQLVTDDGFRNDRKFIVRNAWYSRLGAWLRNHLRFVQGIGAAQRALKYRWSEWRDKNNAQPAANSDVASASEPAAEPGTDLQVYRPPVDANWRQAWEVTERLIAAMNDTTKAAGSKFGVVIGSNGVQVLPSRKEKEDFAKRMGVDYLYYPDRRIVEYCSKRGIPTVDLAPELSVLAERTGSNLHGFPGNIGYGHWNQAGHRAAGQIIAGHLCDLAR